MESRDHCVGRTLLEGRAVCCLCLEEALVTDHSQVQLAYFPGVQESYMPLNRLLCVICVCDIFLIT